MAVVLTANLLNPELSPPMTAFRDYFRQTHLEPVPGGVGRVRQS